MFKRFLSPLVFFVAMGLAVSLLAVIFIIFWSTLPAKSAVQAPTVVLTVIAAPTSTPIPLTPTVSLTPSVTPTLNLSPNGGSIQVGAYVQITGTGGDGLRLRKGPGTDYEQIFLGREAEVFLVKDGPKEGSGYTWYYLEAPYDTNRSGWAVSDFLQVVASQAP
ncbi:hypothetical protein LARV_02376 [Longilinea arvoryzae]|uniref:SH3b domain-containing protein n=1 Tax=Longilinea arvoryzae TaxID=360412 RepID=A0A0S7BKU8_9CHLR|nr:SH3 domain-containing protein [Longilinea arvoryzae]GAP14603.1 hypothetical protein LARV_02376 [Longilinea arvoryzae]